MYELGCVLTFAFYLADFYTSLNHQVIPWRSNMMKVGYHYDWNVGTFVRSTDGKPNLFFQISVYLLMCLIGICLSWIAAGVWIALRVHAIQRLIMTVPETSKEARHKLMFQPLEKDEIISLVAKLYVGSPNAIADIEADLRRTYRDGA